MALPAESGHQLRFGDFRLDLQTGELRTGAQKLYLPEQPFQVLAVLVERPGDLVTRDELKNRLWPANTFVDFDQGLNKAVNRLREVLADSAEHPRYIETLPRRGYRFIAPVESLPGHSARSQVIPIPEVHRTPSSAGPEVVRAAPPRLIASPRAFVAVAVISVILLIVGGVFWQILHRKQSSSAGVPEFKLTQITADSSENAVTGGSISPDGKYLAYANPKGIHIKLIGTDQERDVPQPEEFRGTRVAWTIAANWFGGGTGFVANATPYGHQPSIWAAPALGGPMRKLRDDALAFAVSRDGSQVVFGSNLNQFYYREMWVMRPDGTEARKLFDAEENSVFPGAEWSPDGRRVAYVKWYQSADKGEISIESRSVDGGHPVRAVSIPFDLADWSWSPDGRIITSFPDPSDMRTNTCNFWGTRIDMRTGEPLEQPKRMTNWSGFVVDEPSVSADGKRLALRKSLIESSVYVGDLQANGTRITPPSRLIFSEGRNYPAGWSLDSKAVVFMSDRNGKRGLFRQSLGKDAQSIAANLGTSIEGTGAGALDVVVPRMSPDGAWILYFDWSADFASSAPAPLMRVPVTGGPPQVVLNAQVGAIHSIRCPRAPATACLIAERTPDHGQLVFTFFDPLKGRGQEAARFQTIATPDAEYAWDLSPDGARVAILRRSEEKIQILSLRGHSARQVVAKGWPNLENVNWAADGRRLLVSARTKVGSALLLLDPDGKAHVVSEFGGTGQPYNIPFMGGSIAPWAVPSPDGRHLAICTWNVSANMWMMENF